MDESIEQGAHGGEESAVNNDAIDLNSSILAIPEESEFIRNNPPRSTSINKSQKVASGVSEQQEKKSLWSRATTFGRLRRRSRSAEALEKNSSREAGEINLADHLQEGASEIAKLQLKKSGDGIVYFCRRRRWCDFVSWTASSKTKRPSFRRALKSGASLEENLIKTIGRIGAAIIRV